MLRGWANYFRHGVSARTFDYLNVWSWRRVVNWLRRKHPKSGWRWLRRAYLPRRRPTDGKETPFTQPRSESPAIATGEHVSPRRGKVRRHRRRITRRHVLVESRMRGNSRVRFGSAERGNEPAGRRRSRFGPTLTIGLPIFSKQRVLGCVPFRVRLRSSRRVGTTPSSGNLATRSGSRTPAASSVRLALQAPNRGRRRRAGGAGPLDGERQRLYRCDEQETSASRGHLEPWRRYDRDRTGTNIG